MHAYDGTPCIGAAAIGLVTRGEWILELESLLQHGREFALRCRAQMTQALTPDQFSRLSPIAGVPVHPLVLGAWRRRYRDTEDVVMAGFQFTSNPYMSRELFTVVREIDVLIRRRFYAVSCRASAQLLRGHQPVHNSTLPRGCFVPVTTPRYRD